CMTVQNRVVSPLLQLRPQSWTLKRFSANYLLFLLLADVVILQVVFWWSMELRYLLPFGRTLRPEVIESRLFIPIVALHITVGVIWLLSFVIASVYSASHIVHWSEELQRVILAHTIAALCLAGVLYMARIELMRLVYLYFYLLALLVLVAHRLSLRIWYRVSKVEADKQNILLIGADDGIENIVDQLMPQEWPTHKVIGIISNSETCSPTSTHHIPWLGSLSNLNLPELIRRHEINAVVVALPRQLAEQSAGQTANLIEQLRSLPIQLHVLPDYFDLTLRSASIGRLGDVPTINLHSTEVDTFQRMTKRLIDLVGATCGLILPAPIMVLIAVAIRWQDGGPILYRAERVGEHGRLFTMYKFRSMVVNADRLQTNVNQKDGEGNIIHKQKNDPRVTRLGRFLRRSSLDELPQLINVLKGDMSLVGPRPELPWLVDQYEAWQYRRLHMPQGITGWWQVNGRSNKLMHLNTEQDLYYVENYSLWLDLQILWRTVSVVLRGKGAY
ncbi:MAG: sugar transferase, partial [Caldilineaceae bacterium]|nr:sugar transferase [Caldilineaceae bacterium]